MKVEGRSVFTGRPLHVEIQEGTVTGVSDADARAALPYLAPGFIDLQVNGYRGMDYSSSSFSPEELARMVEAVATSGTTTHLPTVITGPEETIVRNLALLEKARSSQAELALAIPGYHIEGPFISREDGARGAHSPAHVRDADYDEYRRWQEAAGGRIKIVTLAPEVPGALELIGRLRSEGVLVSIGHTAAAPAVIHEAIKAGARLSTHLGNGSHAMLPRLKNYLWEQLAADELTAGIIADGYHLPEAVVHTIARTKGLDRLFLVSDVAVHGGAKPGVYGWGDITVEVFPDGHLGLHGTDFLAGAGHLLDRDVAQYLRFTGASVGDAVRLCSVNPARLLDLPDREDFCRTGAPADLVLFDYAPGGERLEIHTTIQAGRVLHERGGR